MAKPKKRALSLAEQIAGFEDPTPVDLDPEALETYGNASDSGSDSESGDENAGREHYVPVGKSKLRKALEEDDILGKQYEGSRISRAALNSDDEDLESDESDESDDDMDDSEEERAQLNGINSSSEEEENEESEEEPEESEDTELSDEEDDDEDEDDVPRPARPEQDSKKRAELRKLMGEEQQQIVARLSLATESDAKKGKAVIAQRAVFDQLLNARIRLQKALIGVNSLDAASPTNDAGSKDAVDAEGAAVQLWASIGDLRSSLQKSAGDKRSFEDMAATSMSSQDMWTAMRELEISSKKSRAEILQKWSTKVRGVEQLPLNTSLSKTQPAQESIMNYLHSQLADDDRLIKKTQTPRACAPLQANQRIGNDPNIYDDADFYQLLLKELVDQRMANSQLTSGAKARWTAAREAKSKRIVDTKASKGRKLKYTVHEKLQNFMAPENRNAWTERQADELFGSLLGRKRTELAEDMEEDDSDEEVNPMLLFRS